MVVIFRLVLVKMQYLSGPPNPAFPLFPPYPAHTPLMHRTFKIVSQPIFRVKCGIWYKAEDRERLPLADRGGQSPIPGAEASARRWAIGPLVPSHSSLKEYMPRPLPPFWRLGSQRGHLEGYRSDCI